MSDRLDLSGDVERLFAEKMRDFLSWTAANWAVTEKDRQDEAFRDMSDDYFQGYNAGIHSMGDAFAMWIEEYPA